MMNLTPEQTEQMNRLFPRLQSFLCHCQLQNEYRHLRDNEYILNPYQKLRLNELRKCEKLFDRDLYNEVFA